MVQKLLRRCADCGAVLVVDECFLDFLAAREALTAKTVLRDAPNLIILKAFTKLYAMAGVRLGYALCSDAALLDKCARRASRGPCPVWHRPQGWPHWMRPPMRQRAHTHCRPAPKAGRGTAGTGAAGRGRTGQLPAVPRTGGLGAKLRRHGAVVRGCGNYPGLDETWYRTAVRTQKENEQLLKIMREVLA